MKYIEFYHLVYQAQAAFGKSLSKPIRHDRYNSTTWQKSRHRKINMYTRPAVDRCYEE